MLSLATGWTWGHGAVAASPLLTGFANSRANSGLDEQVIWKLQQSGVMNQENDDQCQRREIWHLPLFSPKGAIDTVPLGLGKTRALRLLSLPHFHPLTVGWPFC